VAQAAEDMYEVSELFDDAELDEAKGTPKDKKQASKSDEELEELEKGWKDVDATVRESDLSPRTKKEDRV
jgi:archaellum component FlaC